jgi:hypothetical protein
VILASITIVRRDNTALRRQRRDTMNDEGAVEGSNFQYCAVIHVGLSAVQLAIHR